ncbi:MAG TPA: hypothetical protein VJ813_03680, partial [Vicinamibacterales bacterium]|nr:hypothetical protein [Vicinamibacterales bacterium]
MFLARLLVRLSFAIIRLASVLVPRPSRAQWREEWEAEIQYGLRPVARRAGGLGAELTLLQRSSGSFRDAAWLRRQFTRDAEML